MLTKGDIDWLKTEFIPDLAKAVEDRLRGKLDKIMTILDKFAGDVKDKREVLELHAHNHRRVDKRLERLEKHVS